MTATEDIERQIAVAVVVAVKKAPLLMPVQRVVGGVQIEQAETAYTRFVAGWNARGPKARTGAAKEERR